jgi:hypothetical protein
MGMRCVWRQFAGLRRATWRMLDSSSTRSAIAQKRSRFSEAVARPISPAMGVVLARTSGPRQWALRRFGSLTGRFSPKLGTPTAQHRALDANISGHLFGAKFEVLSLHRMAPTNRQRRPSHFYAARGKYDLWRIGKQWDLVGDWESSRIRKPLFSGSTAHSRWVSERMVATIAATVNPDPLAHRPGESARSFGTFMVRAACAANPSR